MESIKTEKSHNKKGEKVRRKRDLFSRKNEKLLNRKNLVRFPFSLESEFEGDFNHILSDKFKHSGVVYKLINLRPDNHVHKFLVQKIGDSLNIYFVDDNSVSGAEDLIIKLNYEPSTNKVRVFSVFVNNPNIENELNEPDTIIDFVQSYLSDVFYRDFQSVLDQNYNSNLPDSQKPKGTKFIEPI